MRRSNPRWYALAPPPRSWISTTIASIKALADARSDTATGKLVRDFRARHPDVNRGEIVTTLGGAYCRDVMANRKGTLAERQQRTVNFMGSVAQAAAH